MKITSSAGASLKSAGETIFPVVSGSLKSGAVVPSGSMVEGVSAMPEMWRGAENFARGKVGVQASAGIRKRTS
jgi:hypothetical protein